MYNMYQIKIQNVPHSDDYSEANHLNSTRATVKIKNGNDVHMYCM